MDSTYCRLELKTQIVVTVDPRSALVSLTLCRLPFVDETLHGLATLVIPVLSMLQISPALKL